MSKVIPLRPGDVPTTEQACVELADGIEHVFLAVKDFSNGGDHEMAKRVAAHGHALHALLAMRRTKS